MGPKKRWDGYRPFSYLVEGEELARQVGLVEASWVPLADGESARTDALGRDSICVSLRSFGDHTDEQIGKLAGGDVISALRDVWV